MKKRKKRGGKIHQFQANDTTNEVPLEIKSQTSSGNRISTELEVSHMN